MTHSPTRDDQVRPNPNALTCSRYASTFAHMGEVYIYHDLYGYILKMSPDILEFFRAFADPALPDQVCSRYANAFGDMTPESLVGIFLEFGCLITPGTDEMAAAWKTYAVKSRWNVWRREEDGGLTLFCGWGDRPVTKVALDAEDVAVWNAMDSETKLSDLAALYGAPRVERLVRQLAHQDVQAIKLAKVPMSFFEKGGRQHLKPPYLTSTMPYAPLDPDKAGEVKPMEEAFSPKAYYEHEVEDAEVQFDHQETTLSHLFRTPHPALGGRTYGQALVDGLVNKGWLKPDRPLRVLEVGAGLGFVAEAVIGALQARGADVHYDILELSPALAKAQRERLADLPVTVHDGDVLEAEWPLGEVDLFVSNEMIGDLPAVQLTHAQVGLDKLTELDDDAYEEHFQAQLDKLGDTGAMIRKYTMPIGDAPEEFYLNTGAWRLVERVAEHLAPGGVAVLTEFGETGRYPVLSTQLDHPELSIHFGHLMLIGSELGLEPKFEFVMDLIDMDREAQGLATTRSYFKALKALLAEHDVELEKVGYTQSMLQALTAGKIDLSRVGDLRFDRIEDRLMGLVPHEFKALVLTRPAAKTDDEEASSAAAVDDQADA